MPVSDVKALTFDVFGTVVEGLNRLRLLVKLQLGLPVRGLRCQC